MGVGWLSNTKEDWQRELDAAKEALQLEYAAECYRLRNRKVKDAEILIGARCIPLALAEKNPVGYMTNAGIWLPFSQEKADCCAGLKKPSVVFPFSWFVHCKTAKHIARLFDLDPKLFSRYLKQPVKKLTTVNIKGGV